MIGIIIAFILWYLSGGLDMFLHDLPDFKRIFSLPLLVPDANYYYDEMPVNLNEVIDITEYNQFNEWSIYDDYLYQKEDYIENNLYETNNEYNRDDSYDSDKLENDINKIYEDDFQKAVEESIKDLD